MKKLFAVLFLLCTMIAATAALAEVPAGMPADIAKAIADDDKWTGWTITDYVCPDGGNTAFVAMHKDTTNELMCFKKQDGRWNLSWDRNNAVPQGEDVLELTDLSDSRYAGLSRETAFSFRLAIPGAWESIYELDNGIWKLRAIVYCDTDGSPMDFFIINSNHVLYSGWRTDSEVKIYGTVQTDLRYFSYSSFDKDPDQLKKSLSNPPSIPSGTLEAERIKFTGGKKYEVYQGPGESYGRSGNGKAAVSTNDWIQVFGEENGWIMIQYDISRDHMRIGWIRESALPRNTHVSPLSFSSTTAYTLSSVTLTDDPLFTETSVRTISQGTEVEWLATMGEWAYIECRSSSLIRGFVPKNQLSTNHTFTLENYADASRYAYPLRGTLTIASNGSVTMSITSASSMPNGQAVASFALYNQATGQLLATAVKSSAGTFSAQSYQGGSASAFLIVPVDSQGIEDRSQAVTIQR